MDLAREKKIVLEDEKASSNHVSITFGSFSPDDLYGFKESKDEELLESDKDEVNQPDDDEGWTLVTRCRHHKRSPRKESIEQPTRNMMVKRSTKNNPVRHLKKAKVEMHHSQKPRNPVTLEEFLPKLGITMNELSESRVMIQGFNQGRQRAIGTIRLGITIEDMQSSAWLHVINAKTSYNVLLGRPWVHENKVVPSTYHQCLKYYEGKVEKTIVADDEPFTEPESHFADTKFYLKNHIVKELKVDDGTKNKNDEPITKRVDVTIGKAKTVTEELFAQAGYNPNEPSKLGKLPSEAATRQPREGLGYKQSSPVCISIRRASSNYINVEDESAASNRPSVFDWLGKSTVRTSVFERLEADEESTYIEVLKEFRDVFAWSYKEMPGLDPKVAVHYLAVKNGARPVKQAQRPFRPNLVPLIETEVNKLIEAGFIREVKYTTWPPVLAASIPGKPLILYIAAQERSVGALLAQENSEGKENSLYYLSRMITPNELNYSPIEKLCLVLVFSIQKLKHYFQAHVVRLVSKANPIKLVISKPILSDRLVRWYLQFQQFEILYIPQKAIKGQALADFLADHLIPDDWELTDELIDEDAMVVEVQPPWKMYFDGAAHRGGTRAGIVFVTPQVFGDSQLVVNQLLGSYEVKKPELRLYHDYAKKLMGWLNDVNIQYVPRKENKKADALATVASSLALADQAQVTVCQIVPPPNEVEDNGKPFDNRLMNRICDLFGFKQCNSSMYNAATNGLVEAFNKNLCNLLKKVVSKSK
ncbi:uncharacterized protein [Nicotiana sylvestris]|uniref:uncharacterized protein n=1 Tax=Nicotiana sylvestris TaxID=4096 RepID=UPI00388C9825